MGIKPTQIILVEDEQHIADVILFTLENEGFAITHVTTGNDALLHMQKINYTIAILDIGLPDINGFELLKKIRQFSNLPILFLTARAEEIDRVLGLELGADDYVTKPFSPRELNARIKAILRRSSNHSPIDNNQFLSYGDFIFNKETQYIKFKEKRLELHRYELGILVLLLSHPGRVFSRDQIMEHVWEYPEESFDRTVDAHIKNIRSKIKSIDPDADPIITRRGIGYSLREDE